MQVCSPQGIHLQHPLACPSPALPLYSASAHLLLCHQRQRSINLAQPQLDSVAQRQARPVQKGSHRVQGGSSWWRHSVQAVKLRRCETACCCPAHHFLASRASSVQRIPARLYCMPCLPHLHSLPSTLRPQPHLNCTPSLPRTCSRCGGAQLVTSLMLRHSSICQTCDSWRSPVLAWVGASASACSGPVMLGCSGCRGWDWGRTVSTGGHVQGAPAAKTPQSSSQLRVNIACLQAKGGVELGHEARQLAQQLVPAGREARVRQSAWLLLNM